jgi:hypothetical protein
MIGFQGGVACGQTLRRAEPQPNPWQVAKYLRLDPDKQKNQMEETYRYYSKTFPTKPYATADGLEFTAQTRGQRHSSQGLVEQSFHGGIGKRRFSR